MGGCYVPERCRHHFPALVEHGFHEVVHHLGEVEDVSSLRLQELSHDELLPSGRLPLLLAVQVDGLDLTVEVGVGAAQGLDAAPQPGGRGLGGLGGAPCLGTTLARFRGQGDLGLQAGVGPPVQREGAWLELCRPGH